MVHPDAIVPIHLNEEVHFGVMTVKGCMNTFGFSSPKSIITAILFGKVVAEKADADEGERGGVWLIQAESAYAYWTRKAKENVVE